MILRKKSLLLVSLKVYIDLCQETNLPEWRMKASKQNIIAGSFLKLNFHINNVHIKDSMFTTS